MERGNGMSADLRGDLAETEGPGEHDDDECSEAYGRIDADDDADSETPCEAPRRHATPQETEEGPQDLAAERLAKRMWNHHER